MVDIAKVEVKVKELLEVLGVDSTKSELVETPRRVAKYWEEVLEGEHFTNKEIGERFRKDFQVSYDSMVIKECKNIFSHCAHHLALMYNGTVYVAYVPTFWNGKDDSEGYTVIGLSKIPRIVDLCSKRLQMQEQLCADIAESISYATGSQMIYVRCIMDHGCVSARGSRSSGVTDVTYISPMLRKDVDARKEIEGKVQELHLSSNMR